MKFWEKYDLDICVIIGFIMSTVILWATGYKAPIGHLIICLGTYTFTQALYALVYFVCTRKSK